MSKAQRNTLREVMKLAWKMFREHGGDFALALSWAWKSFKEKASGGIWAESIIVAHQQLCLSKSKPARGNPLGTYTGFRGIGLGY